MMGSEWWVFFSRLRELKERREFSVSRRVAEKKKKSGQRERRDERDGLLSDLPDDLPVISLNVRNIVRQVFICFEIRRRISKTRSTFKEEETEANPPN